MSDRKPRKRRPIEDRFWEKVQKTDSCWLWTGSKQGRMGYGYLHIGGKKDRKPSRAHRLSWVIHNGPIPDGLYVLHKCDVPACVNPDHLFLGDHKANMQDCASKGRVCTIGKSRLTHCIRGHEFSIENTFVSKNGHRRCRKCADMRDAKRGRKAAAIRART